MFNQLSWKNQPPEVFTKKAVLKNFLILKRKHLWCGLFFNKGLKTCNFINKRLQRRLFPVNIREQLFLSRWCLFLTHFIPLVSLVYPIYTSENLWSSRHCVKSVRIRSYSGPHIIYPNKDTFHAVRLSDAFRRYRKRPVASNWLRKVIYFPQWSYLCCARII